MVNKTHKTKYSISDLEQVTGVTRRTIHFYTKEKLIPPPEGAGVSAFYNEEHALRIKLIKEMQKSHLKLSGIREALDAMSFADMQELYEKVQSEGASSWNRESIENWMIDKDEKPHQVNASIEPSHIINEPQKLRRSQKQLRRLSDSDSVNSRIDSSASFKEKKVRENVSYLDYLKRDKTEETKWERYEVIDGIEVNVRSDLATLYGSRIKNWILNLKRNLI